MTHCRRCGKDNPAEIHTCTPPRALVLADWLDTRTMKMLQDRQAADELRGLYAEVQTQFQALKAARQLVEACYQSAKKDEALLRQALEALRLSAEGGPTKIRMDAAIAALRERLGEAT